jgi:hypothetical protein
MADGWVVSSDSRVSRAEWGSETVIVAVPSLFVEGERPAKTVKLVGGEAFLWQDRYQLRENGELGDMMQWSAAVHAGV